MIVTLFVDESEARRRKRPRKRAKIINEKKLYERIGGGKAVANIVDEWMRLNLADQQISFYFKDLTAKPESLARFRRQLSDQICEFGEGPCSAKGNDLQKTQPALLVKEDHFLVFADNLVRSMQKFDIAEREKNEMLARMGEYRSDVTPDVPSSSAAVVAAPDTEPDTAKDKTN